METAWSQAWNVEVWCMWETLNCSSKNKLGIGSPCPSGQSPNFLRLLMMLFTIQPQPHLSPLSHPHSILPLNGITCSGQHSVWHIISILFNPCPLKEKSVAEEKYKKTHRGWAMEGSAWSVQTEVCAPRKVYTVPGDSYNRSIRELHFWVFNIQASAGVDSVSSDSLSPVSLTRLWLSKFRNLVCFIQCSTSLGSELNVGRAGLAWLHLHRRGKHGVRSRGGGMSDH